MTTPNHQAELLPCPFCGCDAYVQEDGGRFYVACTSIDCGCCYGEAWDRDVILLHQFLTEAEAIATWNTRPASHEAELVEALEACVAVIDNELGGDFPRTVQFVRELIAKVKAGAA